MGTSIGPGPVDCACAGGRLPQLVLPQPLQPPVAPLVEHQALAVRRDPVEVLPAPAQAEPPLLHLHLPHRQHQDLRETDLVIPTVMAATTATSKPTTTILRQKVRV
jgi:hypothetical protein